MASNLPKARIETLARCLVTCLIVAVATAAPHGASHAQSPGEAVEFDIPAGDLASALDRFAEQSGLQVVSDQPLVAGRRAAALSGRHTSAEALRALLRGTNLEYSFINDTTVVIRHAPPPVDTDTPAAETEAEDGGEPETSRFDEIVVTGSHIRRAGFEGPSPVIVISRQDLDRSGRSTIAEALAQLPQNFASPVTGGSGGTGTQAVNLRGLGADNTLVLINGTRVASSGSSGDAPFVDLNSLPLAAVERIEVLTDGASALYGSDAVTGVVNIILKKDFVGSEISLHYGASEEGGASERQASLTTGWAKGGFNALFSGEYFNRSRLAARGRSFSKTDDLRARGGADRRFNVANPGNVFSLDGQNLPGLDAPSAGIPAGQDGRGLTAADFATTAGQLNRQSLVADFNNLVPETERFGLNARLNGALTPRLTVFAEAGVSGTETEAGNPPPQLAVVVPETNPFNPFGVPVLAFWLATELPPTLDFETDNQRALVGLKGRLRQRWAWETKFGYSRDEFEQRFAPFTPSGPIVAELLSRTDPATALNVFGDGAGANTPEVLADLGFGRTATNGVGDVLTVAGKADGPVLEWAGRELRAALGWEYREESFDSATQIFQVDPQVPNISSVLGGDREIIAGFVELDLPLFGPEHGVPGLRALELQVAARFEHYSDVGDTADPKLALRWQPIESLAVRGSLGTSFRAPSLSELFRAATPFPSTVTDPQRNDEEVSIDVVSGGNPNLEPEESRSWNLGFVWDAPFLPGLSLTTDVWGLRQRERITTLSNQELLAAEAIFPDRVTRAAPTPEDLAAGLPGRLLALDSTSLNASEARLRGVDAGLNYVTDSAVGRFDLRFNGAYTYRATRQLTPVAPIEQLAGTLSGAVVGENTDRPLTKFRANLSLFWSRGAWEVGVTERFTRQTRDPFSTLHPVVDDHYQTDVQINYAWPGDTGWLAGTRLSLGAVNVFNNKPPFRDNFFGFSSALHDPRQAFYQLRLTKAFGKTTP